MPTLQRPGLQARRIHRIPCADYFFFFYSFFRMPCPR
jgi:hypothetical protein